MTVSRIIFSHFSSSFQHLKALKCTYVGVVYALETRDTVVYETIPRHVVPPVRITADRFSIPLYPSRSLTVPHHPSLFISLYLYLYLSTAIPLHPFLSLPIHLYLSLFFSGPLYPSTSLYTTVYPSLFNSSHLYASLPVSIPSQSISVCPFTSLPRSIHLHPALSLSIPPYIDPYLSHVIHLFPS